MARDQEGSKDKSKDPIKEKVKEFPTTSGVYLMKNQAEQIIYVGKAKSLKARVSSYFQNSKDLTSKTRLLVSHIASIDYILTKTEVEAFLLEATLIKKHRPKYNIRLKDDKAYPYIRLSWGDEFPRLYLARKVRKDDSIYFGPYTSGSAVAGTIRFLNRHFLIRDCTDSVFKTRKRPCMTHQIGRCAAPCVKAVTAEEYRTGLEGARDFLSGKNKKVLQDLKKRMEIASQETKYEVAAKLRDSIQAVHSILEKQRVISSSHERDQDAFGFFGDDRGCLIESLHIRSGQLIGHRNFFFAHIDPRVDSVGEEQREWFLSFLNQYYEDNIIPQEVLLPLELGTDLTRLLEAVLQERAGQKVLVRFAVGGESRDVVELANRNAQEHFHRRVSQDEERRQALQEIQAKLGLEHLPKRIECFDISTFQGTETVASQVVFEMGQPHKDSYRRYRISESSQSNDFDSMREVLTRRLKHAEWEKPQLIVVDGGKGQLSTAVKVLQSLGESIPVVGLAKARTESNFSSTQVEASEERFFLPGRSNPVVFRSGSLAFQILVGLRDEAHRFAITYHRKLRENRSMESQLDTVVGLGEKRKRSLLKAFPSLETLVGTPVEEILKVPGMNRVLVDRILLHLQEEDETTDPGFAK